ncbi:MAG: hypothetical protein ACRDU9_06675 [Acidimicrobiia bacterium]
MTSAAEKPQGRRFSISHLALTVPWVALVIDAWGPITDNSFLWHVRAGTLQADLGSVLTTDPFSFTRGGEQWLTQSWLAELLYGWAEDLTGLGFVPYMILVVAILTFLGIGLIAFKHSKSVPATAFVLVLGVLALISFLVPRPVIFSYLLMVLVILVWDRPAVRWALPFLFWIWAAVHGSFVIGLGYIGLRLLMRSEWRAIPTVIVATVPTLWTAHGLGVVAFLTQFTRNRGALEFITEWRKPELLDVVFLPLAGSVVFIVIGAFRHRIGPRHLWLLVPFLLLGMSSVRAIPPAWLALVPLVALSLSGLEIGSRAGLRRHLAIVFGLFVLVLPFLLIEGSELSEDRFPIAALPSLDDSPTFHDDVVGGFLIWEGGPERRVYVDDRAELYGERLEEFVNVRLGKIDWRPIFERDWIRQALLANEEQLILDLEEAGWTTVHRDDSFTVLRP